MWFPSLQSTHIRGVICTSKYISLADDGILKMFAGYAWDGASKFPDFESVIRSSLVHDALYQLMREGLLGIGWRIYADKLFLKISQENGLNEGIANLTYWAIRKFGEKYALPKTQD